MGCSSQQVKDQIVNENMFKLPSQQQQLQAGIKLPQNKELPINYLEIPTRLIISQLVSSKSQEQTNAVTKPNALLYRVAELVVQANAQNFNEFVLVFDSQFQSNQQLQWTGFMMNLLNVFIRRMTKGLVFGIDSLVQTQNNEITLVISTAKTLKYLYSEQKIEQDELEYMFADICISAVKNQQSFIEITYDPLTLNTTQVQLLLKEVYKTHTKLQDTFGRTFASLRKLNQHSLFSFTVLLFTLDAIQEILNGAVNKDLVVSNSFELKYNKDYEKKFNNRSFFSNLIVNSAYRQLMFFIVDNINQYAQTITIPFELRFRPTFLSVFSQMMSFQYPMMYQYQLEPLEQQDGYLTKLSVEKADQAYNKKVDGLLAYLCNQIPEQYRKLVNSIYSRSAIDDQNAENYSDNEENSKDKNQKITEIVDFVLQEYLFSPQQVIDIDVSKYDQDYIQKNMIQIKQEIENNLLGGDEVKIGVTLDQEVFIKVEKVTNRNKSRQQSRAAGRRQVMVKDEVEVLGKRKVYGEEQHEELNYDDAAGKIQMLFYDIDL
ncbi:hypothetical protein SS50377_27637 [Spironucleus salmonicida]|uniref:Uncharacterized protein n=1 Tax=Spironucleus salmonicida TaxID=348837 RepID=V6LPP0_9EUKA|nr:hypothetical protein SS50377_27637 [Spironucleus salmonicida]|eukprot:EST46585.1 Hypothetical protein SS50377_13389 [Spironucleus salmonicida]